MFSAEMEQCKMNPSKVTIDVCGENVVFQVINKMTY